VSGRGVGTASRQGRDTLGKVLGAWAPSAARKGRTLCLGDTSSP